MVMFDESAIEQAGRFATFRGSNPGAPSFRVAREKKGITPCSFSRNMLWRAVGRFVAVVRQNKA